MPNALLEKWNAITLRTKITGVTVLVLTIGLLTAGIGTMAFLKPYMVSQLDARLQSTISKQGTSLANYINPDSDSASQHTSPMSGDLDYYVELFDSSGKEYWANWTTKQAPYAPDLNGESYNIQTVNAMGGNVFSVQNSSGKDVFHAVAGYTVDKSGKVWGTVVIAASLQPTENLLAAYLAIFLGFGIIVVVVGAVLTRMLVKSTFAPLREVERTAASIAAGDFSQRLGGATPNTEVGRLNSSLNTMLNRFDRAFKDRAKTIEQMRRFVGDASHELRTPLVSVRGYAELYRMGALQTPEDVAQAMERIEKEAIRMGGLVEDLLELARLDEAKPLELVLVNLLPLARDAAMDANAANPGRSVTVVTSLPPAFIPEPGPSAIEAASELAEAAGNPHAPDQPPMVRSGAAANANATGPIAFAGATFARFRRRPRRPEAVGVETVPLQIHEIPEPVTIPPLVWAEENKLRQVITNLIGNAVRYTPDGSPIEVGVVVDLPRHAARVDIIDHGEGIPPQIREKIFQRFWRADTSRTRETGGSGLGLAIVSSIIAAHHGSVDVVDSPGGGATFRVSLPLAPEALEPPADRRPAAPVEESPAADVSTQAGTRLRSDA
jgi:two-component system OmpR family sensor kinase